MASDEDAIMGWEIFFQAFADFHAAMLNDELEWRVSFEDLVQLPLNLAVPGVPRIVQLWAQAVRALGNCDSQGWTWFTDAWFDLRNMRGVLNNLLVVVMSSICPSG